MFFPAGGSTGSNSSSADPNGPNAVPTTVSTASTATTIYSNRYPKLAGVTAGLAKVGTGLSTVGKGLLTVTTGCVNGLGRAVSYVPGKKYMASAGLTAVGAYFYEDTLRAAAQTMAKQVVTVIPKDYAPVIQNYAPIILSALAGVVVVKYATSPTSPSAAQIEKKNQQDYETAIKALFPGINSFAYRAEDVAKNFPSGETAAFENLNNERILVKVGTQHIVQSPNPIFGKIVLRVGTKGILQSPKMKKAVREGNETAIEEILNKDAKFITISRDKANVKIDFYGEYPNTIPITELKSAFDLINLGNKHRDLELISKKQTDKLILETTKKSLKNLGVDERARTEEQHELMFQNYIQKTFVGKNGVVEWAIANESNNPISMNEKGNLDFEDKHFPVGKAVVLKTEGDKWDTVCLRLVSKYEPESRIAKYVTITRKGNIVEIRDTKEEAVVTKKLVDFAKLSKEQIYNCVYDSRDWLLLSEIEQVARMATVQKVKKKDNFYPQAGRGDYPYYTSAPRYSHYTRPEDFMYFANRTPAYDNFAEVVNDDMTE